MGKREHRGSDAVLLEGPAGALSWGQYHGSWMALGLTEIESDWSEVLQSLGSDASPSKQSIAAAEDFAFGEVFHGNRRSPSRGGNCIYL